MTGQPRRSASPIPAGYHSVNLYLTVAGVPKLIAFLTQAFDAQLTEKMEGPDGRIMHAEMKIGDTIVMMGEPGGQWKERPCNVYLYVPDVDSVYRRALEAGAKSLIQPADQFYGDRSGAVEDPSGNYWWIATRVEDVPPEEVKRRMEAMMSQQKP